MPKKKKKSKNQRKKQEQVKKFYFNKDDVRTFGHKNTVMEYMAGLVHQDNILHIQMIVLPRLGFDPATPFKILNEKGEPALERGGKWTAIAIPSSAKKAEVQQDAEETINTNGKSKKSKISS